MANNIVSVVIPSRDRPALVTRAVASALSQTYAFIEVIVVVDGPSPSTVEALAHIPDPRLSTIQLPERSGGSKARNIGVQNAKGHWIAFLDDDDEWLPEKLKKQIMLAQSCDCEYPIVTCRLIGRTPIRDYVWPRRLLRPQEEVGDYLFIRKEFLKGEALIQTSTLLAKREFLFRYPFNERLKKHQDTEWIMCAAKVPNALIAFVDEPLVVWNIESDRGTVSGQSDWRYTLSWLQENRNRLSPRAFSSFVLTQLSAEASQERAYQAIWKLLRLAFSEGRPGPLDLLLFAAMWLIPRRVRRNIRASIG